MALENIKKGIINLEKEMFQATELSKKIELVKMYLMGFYYKSAEEAALGKFPDSKLSLLYFQVLSLKMLGPHDPFVVQACTLAEDRGEEVSLAFQNKKLHLVNYVEAEINAAKKTSYKAFELTVDKMEQLSSLIPEEDRVKEEVRLPETSNSQEDEELAKLKKTNAKKTHMAFFQKMMYFMFNQR